MITKDALKKIQENHPNFAYVHFVDPRSEDPNAHLEHFRKEWKGVFLAANGFDPKSGIENIETNKSDLVAFGRHFIANPDLVKRIEEELPLNNVDFSTVYGATEKGYTDYPFYKKEEIVVA